MAKVLRIDADGTWTTASLPAEAVLVDMLRMTNDSRRYGAFVPARRVNCFGDEKNALARAVLEYLGFNLREYTLRSVCGTVYVCGPRNKPLHEHVLSSLSQLCAFLHAHSADGEEPPLTLYNALFITVNTRKPPPRKEFYVLSSMV
jgi:hypothetical protein